MEILPFYSQYISVEYTDKMVDDLVGERIKVVNSERTVSEFTDNTCKCCSNLLTELSAVKIELSSCREIIRILRDELCKISVSRQSSVNKDHVDSAQIGHQTSALNEDWTFQSSKRRSYSNATRRGPNYLPLATSNRFEPLVNLKVNPKDSNDTYKAASQLKQSQPLHGSHMKRCQLQSSKKQSCEVKQKIVIIGDSHTRKCAAELQHVMGKYYSVIGLVKPGAGMGHIINTVSDEIKNLKGDDVLVIGVGLTT
jgi:hypothetical protein